jgi:methionyl-tRNA synthetase
MGKTIFVSTACPYVNAPPHIGHSLEFVQADVIARYFKMQGNDVFFMSGTDDNSLKNVLAAKKEGVDVQKFVSRNAKRFFDLRDVLNISFDDFVRTREERHFKGAQKLWLSFKTDDIYKKNYRGRYCVGCEVFYTLDELVDGNCPEHLKPPVEVEEENYFFKLSNYQKIILEIIASDKLKITPQTRKNEILSFIRGGLKDFSISRSIERAQNWGIPVPNDPSQIMYVWVDALSYYITALDYYSEGGPFHKYWLSSDKRIHVIGKGIIRFHAVYWIAMLLSAGVPLPTEEFVHGYVTVSGGQKISKSLGNVIDPFEVVQTYGTDATRYYLLREIPAYGDGDFSFRRFEELYNADLANGLGNLVARVLALVEKYCGGKVPEIRSDPDSHPLRVDEKIYNWKKAWKDIDEFLLQYRFSEALESVWKFIGEADKYINQNRPWELANKDRMEFNWVVYGLLDAIHQIAWQIFPFMPDTSRKIAESLGIETLLVANPQYKDSWANVQSGTIIKSGPQLFPKI